MLFGQFTQAFANAYIDFNTLAASERTTAVAGTAVTAWVRWAFGIRKGFTAWIAFNEGLDGFYAGHVGLYVIRLASLDDLDGAGYDWSILDDITASAGSMDRKSGDVLIVQGICANGADRSLFSGGTMRVVGHPAGVLENKCWPGSPARVGES